MLNQKKALLLIGSPKQKNSTSEALGNYLLKGLCQKGLIVEELRIISILKSNLEELIDKVNDCDILIISSPLYVDSLPSPVIRALEVIGDSRRNKEISKKQSLVTIINCGFPESFHNDTALRICKNFAHKSNFEWLGGLAMGCGPSINGKPIEELGGMTRNITRALDITVEALIKGEAIPFEAINLMGKNLFPTWLYVLAGNIGWKSQAKKHNAKKELYARPYLEKE